MKLDGRKLKNEICTRKMTLTDFAKKAELPTSTLYRAIGGASSNSRTVGRIAAALAGTPLEILVDAAQIKEVIQ